MTAKQINKLVNGDRVIMRRSLLGVYEPDHTDLENPTFPARVPAGTLGVVADRRGPDLVLVRFPQFQKPRTENYPAQPQEIWASRIDIDHEFQ